MLPIVTACAPPRVYRFRISPFFYCRSQFLGFYLLDSRFPSSLAGLSIFCARTFPLATTILASFAFVCISLHGWLAAATLVVQCSRPCWPAPTVGTSVQVSVRVASTALNNSLCRHRWPLSAACRSLRCQNVGCREKSLRRKDAKPGHEA